MAQGELGLLYSTGRDVPQDDVEASRLFRLPAALGSSTAQYNLGLMYANGWGVPQDDVEALGWFTLVIARSSGEDRDRSMKARDTVAERMTSEQIVDAQRRPNRAEVSHQPTRHRERQMRRFKSVGQLQRFASVHGLVQNLFRVGRHLLRAFHHRLLRTRAFADWDVVTCPC